MGKLVVGFKSMCPAARPASHVKKMANSLHEKVHHVKKTANCLHEKARAGGNVGAGCGAVAGVGSGIRLGGRAQPYGSGMHICEPRLTDVEL